MGIKKNHLIESELQAGVTSIGKESFTLRVLKNQTGFFITPATFQRLRLMPPSIIFLIITRMRNGINRHQLILNMY